VDEKQGPAGPVSLDEAWEKGYSWIKTGDLAPTAVWVAMLLKASGFNQDLAAEKVCEVLTVAMVAASYSIGCTPRTLADSLFSGLTDDESWPKVRERITEYISNL
jgi:hypothetical protein